MTPQAIAAFLDQTITSRIGVRLIAEQHIAVSRATQSLNLSLSQGARSHLAGDDSQTTDVSAANPLMPGGIVDTACSPERMVRMCAAFVASMCDATFGASPEIEIDGVVDAKFA